MPNGDGPKIVVLFMPDGSMQMQSNVSPAHMALAAQFILLQVQAALAPKHAGPGLMVPITRCPPQQPGV